MLSQNSIARPLLFLAIAAIACGCGESKKSGNTVLVGHYAAMSGAQATFGKSTDNGIKLAIEEANADGGINGKQIELITYDDRGVDTEAALAVTRLVTKDEVAAVIGEVASSLSLQGAPICQRYGVPMVTPSSTNPEVTQKGEMIFRVCFIDPFQGSVCAKFAREDLKATKAGILFDQKSAYSKGLAQEFQKAFEAMGGTVAAPQAYNEGDGDVSPQLNTIRGDSPDVVFIPGYYTDVANIARQARKLGIKVPLLGGDGWDSAELAKLAGDSIEGCYYSNHYSQEDPSPRIQAFIAKYKDEYGEPPDGLAALGYDAAKILFDAMKRAPSLSGGDIRDALASTKDFDGVTGKITINSQRDAVKPAVILKMQGGKPTYVTTIEPPK